MKILIFEDEALTAERLIQLICKYDDSIEVLGVISSVEKGLEWFNSNACPDLIFMDIQLSDGYCFEIFNLYDIEAPVIFATAFDEYALKAFKFNSVDYLLKPIDFKELSAALDKFLKYRQYDRAENINKYNDIYNHITKSYKKRFLVKIGEQLKYINAEDIAYFVHDSGIVSLISNDGKEYFVDYSLDKLENLLNSADFFRLNRKMIAGIKSIKSIHSYFNSRLKIELNPAYEDDIIVSRDRAAGFKDWLNS